MKAKEVEVFVISYTEGSGRKYIVAITDDLDKWLIAHNKERDKDCQESVSDFSFEKVTLTLWKQK